jgi:DNA-binding beta-propeller fold protein YncE
MARKIIGLVGFTVFFALAGWSCTLNNAGEEPPEKKLYFPVAVALSPTTDGSPPRYLFVANSNFDVKYSGGSLQVYDLNALDSAIRKKGKCSANRSGVIENSCVFKEEVLTDSFAAGLAVSAQSNRIYIPTRADTNLTYIDFDQTQPPGKMLKCGQGSGRRCSRDYERGDESVANELNLTIPRDPIGIVVRPGPESGEEEVLLAHRGGEVSLFVSDKSGPLLKHVLTGLAPRVTGIALNPSDGFVYLTNTDVENVEMKFLSRVGVAYPSEGAPFTYLYNAGIVELNGFSYERDTRAVAFSASLPEEAFVVTASPSALAVVDLNTQHSGSGETLVNKAVETGTGASRITLGTIGNDQRLFAFISCYESREFYIIDVASATPVAVVHGFSGPFEMALDSARQYVYVADFRSSVVRIIDLTPITCNPNEDDSCSGEVRIVATLGNPTPPEELL